MYVCILQTWSTKPWHHLASTIITVGTPDRCDQNSIIPPTPSAVVLMWSYVVLQFGSDVASRVHLLDPNSVSGYATEALPVTFVLLCVLEWMACSSHLSTILDITSLGVAHLLRQYQIVHLLPAVDRQRFTQMATVTLNDFLRGPMAIPVLLQCALQAGAVAECQGYDDGDREERQRYSALRQAVTTARDVYPTGVLPYTHVL
jgi:hypothetical protein